MRGSSAVGHRLSVGVVCMASVLFALLSLLMLFALLLSAGTAAAQTAQPAVPTAARALPRGYALTAEDLVHAEGPPAATDDLVGPGWVTRRAVRAGEPLREPTVAPPPVVLAGEAVEAVWAEGGIEVRVRGTALATAAAGQRVAIRTENRRRIEGVAVAPGEVRINLIATRR